METCNLGVDCGAAVWVAVDDLEGQATSVETVGTYGEGGRFWALQA